MSDKSEKAPVRHRRGLHVEPSPLNAVKLELAIILVAGLILGLAHGRLSADPGIQFLILVGYGVGAMAWLVLRTRRVLRSNAEGQPPADDDQEQA